MTFAGIAMRSVGDKPRQRDGKPSFRAILRRPSSVEVNVLRRVSSTAQSAAEVPGAFVREGEVAMQYGEALFTQKTSRQHEVTPMFGGRFVNEGGRVEGRGMGGVGCDWRRTRTTSRGVTREGGSAWGALIVGIEWATKEGGQEAAGHGGKHFLRGGDVHFCRSRVAHGRRWISAGRGR